jgi:hypothetical protein
VRALAPKDSCQDSQIVIAEFLKKNRRKRTKIFQFVPISTGFSTGVENFGERPNVHRWQSGTRARGKGHQAGTSI